MSAETDRFTILDLENPEHRGLRIGEAHVHYRTKGTKVWRAMTGFKVHGKRLGALGTAWTEHNEFSIPTGEQ